MQEHVLGHRKMFGKRRFIDWGLR